MGPALREAPLDNAGAQFTPRGPMSKYQFFRQGQDPASVTFQLISSPHLYLKSHSRSQSTPRPVKKGTLRLHRRPVGGAAQAHQGRQTSPLIGSVMTGRQRFPVKPRAC